MDCVLLLPAAKHLWEHAQFLGCHGCQEAAHTSLLTCVL